ncbi:hypothetical protein CLV78_105222 [Aliiruegeria haliotis]|uniref:Uncharacterized protein n=1 Tax=Aliiruegeria haliotis TaxID=1280846 RepID=A0A2T0RPR4_9RHOB|nr:hypothetical protein CLV78_105222 [Aliiruegeria haliotis]
MDRESVDTENDRCERETRWSIEREIPAWTQPGWNEETAPRSEVLDFINGERIPWKTCESCGAFNDFL